MPEAPGAPETPVPFDPRRPVLATGLAAFVIANGVGDLSLAQDTRGAELDWGGLYAGGVHLTGPWTVEYRTGGEAAFAVVPARSVRRVPGGFRVSRQDATVQVEERVTVHPSQPRILLERRIARTDGSPAPVTLSTTFEPWLAPVLLEGIRPTRLQFRGRGPTLQFTTEGFGMSYDADPLADRISLDGSAWIGRPYDGPPPTIRVETDLTVPAGTPLVHRTVIAGGRKDRFPTGPVTAEVLAWPESARRPVEDWLAASPRVAVEGAPEIGAAYDLARAALRSLYTAPEPGFQGLVAGYPWYASLWCRDAARMIPALLWMGDAPWVASTLDTMFRFQAPTSLPVLGATAGELPMQISPGPIFLYGTADTSLYFPEVVRRYIAHTGDVDGARRWFPGLEGVRGWGLQKLSPTTGLLRHGGEIEGLRDALGPSARIQFGIDAPDTTIWDSADRRDHAVDIQLLWLQALRAFHELASFPGAPAGWRDAGPAATEFAGGLPARYRWSDESYLYDSVRTDGTPVQRLRPNALQWVGQGILAAPEERGLVERALRDDLATPWGLRTVASTDPGYDPLAYHMGRVWPITSAWAALAALRSGALSHGGAVLARMARQLVAEDGYSHECYRGDRPEPFDSCFLLGFSVAPFLVAVFDGLLGLTPDAAHRVLSVAPAVPPGWGPIRVQGLAIAGGSLDLTVDADRIEAVWHGPGPLVVAAAERSVRMSPGDHATVTGPAPRQP